MTMSGSPCRARPLLCLASMLVLAACSTPDRESASPTTMRDSAGIAIVESAEPAWGEGAGWTVADAPALDLRKVGSGPAYDFFRVRDAERLPDGSVVVADGGSAEIRGFSSEGEHQWTVGRAGHGPGEYRSLSQVWRSGDSIMAYDRGALRTTVIAPDGSVARMTTMREAGRPTPIHPLQDGGYVGLSMDISGIGEELGLQRWWSHVLRLDSDGGITDTIASIPGNESVVFSFGDAVAMWAKQAYLTTRGEDVVVGSADGVEFRVLSLEGEVLRIVRAPEYDLSLTPEEVEAEFANWYPDSLELSAMSREMRDRQPQRKHRPGYQSILVDDSGHVWLQLFEARHEVGDSTRWLVFEPEGRWLGAVTLPPRFDVFRIGSDWILGTRIDELDVEHVQVLTLHRDDDAASRAGGS